MVHPHELSPAAHALVAKAAAFDLGMVRALLEVVFVGGPLRETARDCGVDPATLSRRRDRLREDLADYCRMVGLEGDPAAVLLADASEPPETSGGTEHPR